MTNFTFDDVARTTLGAATKKVDESRISNQQMMDAIEYLTSPGSGSDAATSAERAALLGRQPAERICGRLTTANSRSMRWPK